MSKLKLTIEIDYDPNEQYWFFDEQQEPTGKDEVAMYYETYIANVVINDIQLNCIPHDIVHITGKFINKTIHGG
jgi:predicted P-loop ATPase